MGDDPASTTFTVVAACAWGITLRIAVSRSAANIDFVFFIGIPFSIGLKVVENLIAVRAVVMPHAGNSKYCQPSRYPLSRTNVCLAIRRCCSRTDAQQTCDWKSRGAYLFPCYATMKTV